MSIEAFTPAHPRWPAYVDHLTRTHMERWTLDADGMPLPNLHYLGAISNEGVVGSLTLLVQDILLPAGAAQQQPPVLTGPDGMALRETFVQTYVVEPNYRRHGFGRALQIAAIKLTRQWGCYQMRSWSSADKNMNYALKLELGFAALPAIQTSTDGEPISGVHFIKTV